MIFLAWLAAHDTPFDPVAHAVEDVEAFSGVVVEREEGDVIVPYFTVNIANPGIKGIVGRPERYAVLSERPHDADVAVELARGRLTGLPTNLGSKECTLEFLCVPPDEDEVLRAAADLLRVGEVDYDPEAPLAEREAAEMYDPLFFDADASEDPTTVVLARRQLWRWDRKTLTPHLVHLTDGVYEHQVHDALYDTVALKVTTPAKAVSKIRGIIDWTQLAKDIQTFNHLFSFNSFTHQDFLSAIPKAGDAIGPDTGWSIASFEASSVPNVVTFTVKADSPEYGDAKGGMLEIQPHLVSGSWRAAFDWEQPRQEIFDVSMPAATQKVLGDSKTETIEVLNAGQVDVDLVTKEWEFEDPETFDVIYYDVGEKRQANGRVYQCVHPHFAQEPFRVVDQHDETLVLWERTTKRSALRDMRTPRIAELPRGQRIIRYLERRLDRRVCRDSRAAEITLEREWPERPATTEDTMRVFHNIIPGYEAVGKVVSAELVINGHSRFERLVVLASIGDGTLPPADGEIAHTISYGRCVQPVDAYALAGMAPYANDIVNDADTQIAAANLASFANLDPMAAIGAIPTQLQIGFPTLRQEDQLRRRVTVTCAPAYIPKGINIAPDLGGTP